MEESVAVLEPTSRILWATDPYQDDGLILSRTLRVLRSVSKRCATEITPVHVLNPKETGYTGKKYAGWRRDCRQSGERVLGDYLKSCTLPSVITPKVLILDGPTMRRVAQRLVEYAGQNHADLIVVATHARQGIPRLVFGSFAETLLYHSHIPVLIVNPSTWFVHRFDHILFPTDFSAGSKSAFEKVAELSKKWGARVTVFHKISKDLPYFSRENRSESWTRWAKELVRGVDLIEDETLGKTPSEAILSASKREKVGLIAQHTRTGALRSALFGSTAQEVIRHATCPVLALHEAYEKAEEEKVPRSSFASHMLENFEMRALLRGFLL